jgi:hypothetical protein
MPTVKHRVLASVRESQKSIVGDDRGDISI